MDMTKKKYHSLIERYFFVFFDQNLKAFYLVYQFLH